MTGKQNGKYFGLWRSVQKIEPTADRHEVHARLGLPESHAEFSQDDMDEWIGWCEAVIDSGNFDVQLAQANMPATRARVFIGHLTAALEVSDNYAQSILTRMQRGRKLALTGSATMLTLQTAKRWQLKKVIVALKKECKRRWATKGDLLGVIRGALEYGAFDSDKVRSGVADALNVEEVPAWENMPYEDLLVAMAVLQRMPAEDAGKVDAPF